MTENAVVIARETPDQPDVRALIAALDAMMVQLYPPESNHLVDTAALCGPDTVFLVARRAGVALGCAAMVVHDGYAELKRMYVTPDARGLGIAGQLVQALEGAARAMGVHVLRLEMGIYQPEALALYRRQGFREIAPFAAYRHDPLSLFMEKDLTHTDLPA